MFKSITLQERLQKAEAQNSALRAQLAQTVAQTAYIAMMGDVNLPVASDAAQQLSLEEGSDDNE
jgi:cell shape-determining protein MreC